MDKWDLHYIEYDQNVSLHQNSYDTDLSNLFLEPSVSNSSGLNKVFAKKYIKDAFYN